MSGHSCSVRVGIQIGATARLPHCVDCARDDTCFYNVLRCLTMLSSGGRWGSWGEVLDDGRRPDPCGRSRQIAADPERKSLYHHLHGRQIGDQKRNESKRRNKTLNTVPPPAPVGPYRGKPNDLNAVFASWCPGRNQLSSMRLI